MSHVSHVSRCCHVSHTAQLSRDESAAAMQNINMDPGDGNKGSPRQAAACSRKSDLDPPLCGGGTILCTSCTILCTICPFVAGGTAHNVLQCHISYTRRPRPPDTAHLRDIACCLRSGNTFLAIFIRDNILLFCQAQKYVHT